ncbi:hypothetical protein EOPP23_19510 [Endozoicomonas sp. OPT23]|uniref:hypothetical protein n=1 Tax=Endozoicomonas sp. OPT23 TaxID=2072845 RepID=UPI00129BA223|nr:hypothetical protein [Endozoicomonas sp. OPT23]MRI35158.1 hypothetical protein [Endozoicomonas sp. OPT23]
MPFVPSSNNRSTVEVELKTFTDKSVQSTAAARTARGRTVSAADIREKLLNLVRPDFTKGKKSLYSRMTHKINISWLKFKVMAANIIFNFYALMDDQLVMLGNAIKVNQTPEPTIRDARGGVRNVRPSALGPAISENTDMLFGCNYLNGIPESQKHYFTKPRLVVIKGGATNKFGHALLAFGEPGSATERYAQISSANWYPEFLDGEEFSDYQEKWKNEIAYEIDLQCEDEDAMRNKLDELASRKWLWGGPEHNCLSFVKDVAEAGKSRAGFFDGYSTTSNRLMNAVISGISEGADKAILATMDKHSAWKQQLELIQQSLCGILEVDEFSLLTSSETEAKEFISSRIEWLHLAVDSAYLPERVKKSLIHNITASCKSSANAALKRAYDEFPENEHRDLADLPLPAAYNAPAELRRVGPQTIAGFNDGNDDL